MKDNGAALAGPNYCNGPVIDTNGVIYYGSTGAFGYGSVYAFNSDGSPAWAYSVNSEVECPLAITPDGHIIVGATDSLKLIALKGSGSPLATSVWPAARRNLANMASHDYAISHPMFQPTRRMNNVLTFTWTAIVGKNYQLQFKTNLLQANWNNLGAVIPASGSTASTTDSITTNKQRFYRVFQTQ